MKKIVVTGLSGTIGSILLKRLPSNVEIWNLYHSHPSRHRKLRRKERQVDLTVESDVTALLEKIRPEAILHMAGMTHIDRCEDDKKNGKSGIVWKTNVLATKYLVSYAKKSGAYLCFLSTECVFDGKKKNYTESDPQRPINWYGKTKAEAEKIVQSAPHWAIVRSIVAFHEDISAETIYAKFFSALVKQIPIQAVNDTYFSPTYTHDIVNVINKLLLHPQNGIFHICSPDLCTPYSFAKEIARKNGIDLRLIHGISSEALFGKKRASIRLHYSTFSTKLTKKKLGLSGTALRDVFESFTV